MSARVKEQVYVACSQLMRPIVGFLLRSGVTWKEFSGLCKGVFVDVARDEYGVWGRPANNSRVAILTGLDRKEVKRQRDLRQAGQPFAPNKVSHAGRVLSGWYQDPDYTDADGTPLELPLDGEDVSFSKLLQRYGGDIPPGALLKELERVQAVERTAKGTIRALRRSYIPVEVSPERVQILGQDLHDLGHTITYNLTHGETKPAWFQRVAVNESVSTRAIDSFRQLVAEKGQAFLEEFDEWLSAHEVDGDDGNKNAGIRTGVGIYFFKDATGGGGKS